MFSLPIIAPPTRGGDVYCLTSYLSSTVRGKKLKGQSSKRKSIRGPKNGPRKTLEGENITGTSPPGKAAARRIALRDPPEWNYCMLPRTGEVESTLVRDNRERNRLSRHCQVSTRQGFFLGLWQGESGYRENPKGRNPERGAGRHTRQLCLCHQ